MKKLSIAVFSVGFVGLIAAQANAQCNFDVAAKGKGLKTSMIRSFAGCPSLTVVAPNTLTGVGGTPACTPTFAHSPYLFGPKGACDLKTSHKLEDPCKDGSGIPCSNISLKGKCKDVLQPNGVTPINADDTGFQLNTVSRATFDDNTNGDMTVIDFPASAQFDEPKKGGTKLKTDTTAILASLFGPGSALPGCTTLAIVSAAVADPDGLIFATMGSSSPGN